MTVIPQGGNKAADPRARDADCGSTQSMVCLGCGFSAQLEMLLTEDKSWELHSEGLVSMELSQGEPDPWLEVVASFLLVRIEFSFLLKII